MARKDEKSLYSLGLRGKSGKVLTPSQAGSLQSFLDSVQGQTLRRGGQIQSGELPLNLRSAIGAGDYQGVGIRGQGLKAINDMEIRNLMQGIQNARINSQARSGGALPIESTTNVANSPTQLTGAAEMAGHFDPLEQQRTGGLIRSVKSTLNNKVAPKINAAARTGALGVAPFVNQVIGDIRNPNSTEGIRRIISDLTKKATNVLQGTTEEEPTADLLYEKFPELRGVNLREVAGLTFEDSANRKFRINELGKIQRIK